MSCKLHADAYEPKYRARRPTPLVSTPHALMVMFITGSFRPLPISHAPALLLRVLTLRYDGERCVGAVFALYAPVYLASVLLAAALPAAFDFLFLPAALPWCLKRVTAAPKRPASSPTSPSSSWLWPCSRLRGCVVEQRASRWLLGALRTASPHFHTVLADTLKRARDDAEEARTGQHQVTLGLGGGGGGGSSRSGVSHSALLGYGLGNGGGGDFLSFSGDSSSSGGSTTLDVVVQQCVEKGLGQLLGVLVVSVSFGLAAPAVGAACAVAACVTAAHHGAVLAALLEAANPAEPTKKLVATAVVAAAATTAAEATAIGGQDLALHPPSPSPPPLPSPLLPSVFVPPDLEGCTRAPKGCGAVVLGTAAFVWAAGAVDNLDPLGATAGAVTGAAAGLLLGGLGVGALALVAGDDLRGDRRGDRGSGMGVRGGSSSSKGLSMHAAPLLP